MGFIQLLEQQTIHLKLRTTQFYLYRSFLLEYLPNFRRGNGDIQMCYAQVRKRIYNRVCNRRRCTYCWRLSYSFGPYRMMWRRSNRMSRFPTGRFYCGRNQIVHKGPVEDISILVVDQGFIHSRGNSLGQASMNLSLAQSSG